MHINFRLLLGALAVCIATALPSGGIAAESTSYKLYADPGNAVATGPMVSLSYTMNSDTVTWRALPGISTSYQVVLAPHATSSSSSSSASVAGTSDGTSGGERSGGGRRGQDRDPIFELPEESASSSLQSRSTWSTPELIVEPGPSNLEFFTKQPLPTSEFMLPVQAASPSEFQKSRFPIRSVQSSSTIASAFHTAPPEPVASTGIFGYSTVSAISFVFASLFVVTLAGIASLTSGCSLGTCIANRRLLRRFFFGGWLMDQEKKKRVWKATHAHKRRVGKFLALMLILPGMVLHGITVRAATTAPQRIVYNGHLLDNSGTAVTSAVKVRFSFWNSGDYVSGDVTGTGAVNTAASTYASWNEVHSVTPNSQGYFSLEMGSVTSLPNFSSMSTATLLSLYLQVEVKAGSSADTSYELLDFDTSSTTSDRSPLRSVPFALNADLLDQRDIGTGSGNIAILGSGGVFHPARIPGGTNSGTFVIDRDGSDSTTALQFGNSVTRQLSYDGSNGRFNFNDDVQIQGDLTVTGVINGINLTTLAGNAPLKVSSGAGLNITINAGSYRLNGSVTNYGGSSTTVSNNASNYVFFGSGGLAVSTIGFPSDESVIRLAQVVTSGGAITSVSDRRVTSSDDRERTVEDFLHAAFSRVALKADGSNNVGQLSVSHDATSKRNYYLWTSTRSTLQDYDVYVRVSLGSDFVGWVDNPLQVTYRTSSGSTSANTLGVAVYDTAGNAVTLSGSTTSLASTSWATTQVEFSGAPTFTAGQDILIKFTLAAKSNAEVHLASMKVQMRELLQ